MEQLVDYKIFIGIVCAAFVLWACGDIIVATPVFLFKMLRAFVYTLIGKR